MDKLLFENYLLILKSTMEVYVHGTLESSNSQTRKVLNTMLNNTLKSQEDTYNFMVQNGWYNVTNISESIISKTYNKVKTTKFN